MTYKDTYKYINIPIFNFYFFSLSFSLIIIIKKSRRPRESFWPRFGDLHIHMKLLWRTRNKTDDITSDKTNWKKFRHTIDNLIFLNIPLNTPADLDTAVQSFTTIIEIAAPNSSQTYLITFHPTKVLPLHSTTYYGKVSTLL